MMDAQARSKYNTWTPAEARKLNKFLTNGSVVGAATASTYQRQLRRPPIRTASVRHKPRPPPMVVTDLDSDNDLFNASTLTNSGSTNRQISLPDESFSSAQSKFSTLDFDFVLDSNSLRRNDRAATIAASAPRRPMSENLSSCKLDNSNISESKTSLSSSTYKVFRGPLSNIKKFFNHMPRAIANAVAESHNSSTVRPQPKSQNRKLANGSIAESTTLGDSISQICLNQSQSPPSCPPPPPPPCELKSMSYMESAISYSNYDEFTRSRNERVYGNSYSNLRESRITPICTSTLGRSAKLTKALHNSSLQKQPIVFQQIPKPQQHQKHYDVHDGDSSWQLTSLPVSYERNLAVVQEELCNNLAMGGGDTGDSLIRPPLSFCDDSRNNHQQSKDVVPYFRNLSSRASTSNSSLASITTTESVLDYHRQTGTTYRFSFAQPAVPTSSSFNANNQRNVGLPPRAPLATPQGEQQKNENTSSGNSSNSSSQSNGINNFDARSRIVSSESDKNSYTEYATTFGNLNGLDADPDVTLLSETSTIVQDGMNGDTETAIYANKFTELENQIESLKQELLKKEEDLVKKDKALREMDLKQMHQEFKILQLKSQFNKLEKENSQLKSQLR